MKICEIIATIILILFVILLVVLAVSLIYGLCTDTPNISDDSSSNFNLTTWVINPANPASPIFRMIH